MATDLRFRQLLNGWLCHPLSGDRYRRGRFKRDFERGRRYTGRVQSPADSRTRIGRASQKLTGHQGSGNLLSLIQANALLMHPRWCKMRACWQEVNAWLL